LFNQRLVDPGSTLIYIGVGVYDPKRTYLIISLLKPSKIIP